MNARLDPANNVRVNSNVIDFGDKASTYIFDGGTNAVGINQGNQGGVHLLFKNFAATNDNKRAGDFLDDGGHQRKLELFDADGKATDDFIAMVKAAWAGEGGMEITITAADEIEIMAGGRWSTDKLIFRGDWVTDALAQANTGFDLQNVDDQFKVFTFDDDGKQQNIYTGGGRDLIKDDGYFGDIFTPSFLNEGAELQTVVNAALTEHYGLGDTKDMKVIDVTDDSVVIEVTTHNGNDKVDGVQAKTMIINGGTVENLISDFKIDLSGGLNTGNNSANLALYDTDAQKAGSVFFGSASQNVDVNASQSLQDVTGNALNQLETATNANQEKTDDIDEFVFAVLANDGTADVSVVAGGQKGDDFLTVTMVTQNGYVDTLILEGDRVGDAIDHFADTGTQYDFFA
jgi:hypothetical protein